MSFDFGTRDFGTRDKSNVSCLAVSRLFIIVVLAFTACHEKPQATQWTLMDSAPAQLWEECYPFRQRLFQRALRPRWQGGGVYLERRQGHAFNCDFALSSLRIQIANGNEVKKVQASATACAASRPVMPQSHDMTNTAGRKYKP